MEDETTNMTIQEIRLQTGLTRKEFCVKYGLPIRKMEDWEAGRRNPPEYIPRMLAYYVGIEKTKDFIERGKRNINIVRDTDGNKIVVIHDIIFKNKQKILWSDVEKYLERYIGDIYMIEEDREEIYIGKDLPDEYAGSRYIATLKGGLAKAKANAAQAIPELIELSVNKSYQENLNPKHKLDARYGWYRYDVRFAIAVYNEQGEVERYNVYKARMIIRHDADGKKYLYDIINIKKEPSTPLGQI